MKHLLPITLLSATLLISTASFAEGGFYPNGSQQGKTNASAPASTVVTVAQARQMRDDDYVRLQGTIKKHLRKDHYLFADRTGEIVVEIDHDKWDGQKVTPQNKVEIYAKVDKSWRKSRTKLDVKEISIVK